MVFDTEFNLAFHTPKKDACKYCEWYQRLEDSEKESHKDDFDAHTLRKKQAREHKDNDKNESKGTGVIRGCHFWHGASVNHPLEHH